jgi:hypothetical protein
MSGERGYHALYNALAFAAVRLSRPKPFVVRMFFWPDIVGEIWGLVVGAQSRERCE